MGARSQRLRRIVVGLSAPLLLTGFAAASGPAVVFTSAARFWVDGRADAALAALAAAAPARERELNRAVVLLYSGEASEATSELTALHEREPRWAPVLRWLARAQEASGPPGASPAALLTPASAVGSDPRTAPPGLHPGETLRYRVHYLFINLASVTLETGGAIVYRGRPAHRIVFSAKSNDAIPFFHIDSRFESIVDQDGAVLAHRHVASDSDSGSDEAAYDMDREARRCTVRTVRDGLFEYEVLPLPENAQDGVSVLRVARALARARDSAVVPTAVDSMWCATRLQTLGVERIRWQGRDVQAVRIQSTGRYRGPGGMSGAVDIWISDDERSVPYRVKMKVAVGSVSLELLPDEPTTLASTGGEGGA